MVPIETRRPDLAVFEEKMNSGRVVDVAIPGDRTAREKKQNKSKKYHHLKNCKVIRVATLTKFS